MTNFEKITQSPEAFANELLMRKSPCCYCAYKPDEGLKLKLTLKDIFEKTPCADEDCAEGITKWLNEPESGGKRTMIDERHMCRAKRIDNGDWVTGYYLPTADGRATIIDIHQTKTHTQIGYSGWADSWLVDPSTVEPVAAKVKKKLCSESEADAEHTYFYYLYCPNCNSEFGDTLLTSKFFEGAKYCIDCGQRLDWDDLLKGGGGE